MSAPLPEPPNLLPPSACRWSCPPSWVRGPLYSSPEPVGLWGQLRVLSALDVLTWNPSEVPPAGLDISCSGRPGQASSVAQALSDRLPGRVVLLSDPSARALRGRGSPGLLGDPEVAAVVIDPRQLTDNEDAWNAVREALLFGTCAELEGEQGAGEPPAHALRALIVIVGPDSGRKKLRETDPTYNSLWVERVAFEPDLPRDRAGVAVVVARLRQLSTHVGEVTNGAWRFFVEELAGRPSRRTRVALRADRVVRALVGARVIQPTGALSVQSARQAWSELAWRGGVQQAGHRERVAKRQLQFVTDGVQRGVVNGLMVYGGGDTSYCIPGRITARVSVGREGIINIEREAKYSGRSFDKGVFHLAGWLRGTFVGNTHPLGLAASIAFEQSYGKVDGDSATLAETLAILSELSGLPLRQDVAITGAITQRGELLPIGSASLKVRGFWESCKAHGPLTGRQGVLLPAASVIDLQVDREVLTDIRAGRFHIWSAERIEDAAELLMNRASGRGTNRPGAQTVLGLVARRLRQMSERLYPPRKPTAKSGKAPAKAGKTPAVVEKASTQKPGLSKES